MTRTNILSFTINDVTIDLTAFIDLNKATFLSAHHGRCIVFNVRSPQSIRDQLKNISDLNAIDFNIQLNYFTEIPGIYKTNYELIIFRIFTGAQTAINVIYYDRSRTFQYDLKYWEQRLAITQVVYRSYSTARVCTFYPPTLKFKHKKQIHIGKCIENPGKGKYWFFNNNGKKVIASYSRSVEARDFRKHLNLLEYGKKKQIKGK